MSAPESIVWALTRNWEMVDAALEGLDEAMMLGRPNRECNSISWILWHMNRVMDTFVNTRFREVAQLWVSDGWSRRYSMGADPDERGVGWTAAQVDAWPPPSREIQLGYYETVKADTRSFLQSATEAELQKTVVFPRSPEPRPVSTAIGQMTFDVVAHGGQIAFLRGYFLGMGWHR